MHDDMTEATRLTRSGRLAEATALIQRTLGRRPGPAPAPGRGLGTPGPARPQPEPQPGPGTGGRFLDESFRNAAGARGYKLYVPSGYGGQAVPPGGVLHRCPQTPGGLAAR